MLLFLLVAVLLYPDGRTVELDLGRHSRQACEREAGRAAWQLPQTLSVAELIGIECRPEALT